MRHHFLDGDGSCARLSLIPWRREQVHAAKPDINIVAGDEQAFLVVGAPNAGPGDRGRTYVYRGREGKLAFIIESDEEGSQLGGMFVSVVGDVNADGTPDIYASDWNHNAKGPMTGQIYVHSGIDGKRLMTLTGESDGDGVIDLLLTSAWSAMRGAHSGRMFIVSSQ